MSEPKLRKAVSAIGALSTLALLSGAIGCGIGPAAPNGPVTLTGISVAGTVHGGEQPLSNATINLYSAGTTGYGTGATQINTNTTAITTDTNGAFSLPVSDYTCSSPTTEVYITATGGDSSAGSNSNIELAAPLGECGTLSSSSTVNINEVTTAAMAVALGQYFTTTFGATSTDGFGATNTTQGQVGLTNAFATVNNLVNVSIGQAITSQPLTGAGGTITMTPEAAKLNTIADVLAACVNTTGGKAGDGSNCGVLFGDTHPDSATPATDTLQAAVYMSLNPTSNNVNTSSANMASLYGIIPATPPFADQSTQPTDWTVGIQYQDTTTGTPVLPQPQNIAIDAQGNVWVLSYSTSALGELSPTGTPLVGTTFSGSLTGSGTRNLAIDTNGNVWITASSSTGYLFEYVPGSATYNSLALGKSPYGIAIDGSNDVFVGKQSTSAGSAIQEFLGGNLNVDYEVNYPTVGTTSVCASSCTSTYSPEYMAIDTTGNLWFAAASSSATGVYALSNINTSSCGSTPFAAACNVTSSGTQNTYTAVATGTEPWGVAANSTPPTPPATSAVGSIWVVNEDDPDVTDLPLTFVAGTNYGSSSSMNEPHYIAVDGLGNNWISNKNEDAVTEIGNNGTVLSGSGFAHNGIDGSQGIGVDPSGNVWVADTETSGADGTSVFELVGAAAPTVTPLASALKTSNVAQRP